ncbi:glutamate--tRNA ligase, chloroplastic/mitochondrial [Zea mays]|uniref:Glutamate--tRNA ligase, chloroplastic/mitochondrial n=1 Tax=Zea mays TaxID=4577 RepID=A0A804P4N5_MAIZE|nr:glutamate--tRNA ligase, chloroplastic/mitochondrial [Zea mays]|eukprot:XP_020408524.1 glutamate--tRNA ligase, chloroplastic/mitochondrial [Zea mays]
MAASALLTGSPWLRMRLLPDAPARPFRRLHLCRALSARASAATGGAEGNSGPVRVRFAPSPTGNLHVGGARTALFNYLFARSKGGRFVLRVEDTDLERSTRKSEEAVLADLAWLGLEWDEGPDVGGEFGPYRQSERNSLYKKYAEKLLDSGAVYRCFCSNEELEQMKEVAKQRQLPPVYMGKWASASDAEVHQELEKGTPYTYRFHVPKEGSLKINDLIRGEVSWNLDTLGDFVIMRSNGQPVYNFCVTVDDATMQISHVIRAEEHLPNTLRQALIYKALGFAMPSFAHVSLILAPDRSKLSKRHGATSVGQYKEMGYLPQAMVNYLALLGWGDGTENEFFTIDDLVHKFTINRVNKSGAVFDATKLKWMNGQHLRSFPHDELIKAFEDRWKDTGILQESESSFAKEAAELLKDGIDLITDADAALTNLLSYPLHTTLSSEEAKPVVQDKISEVASSLISAYDSGELTQALAEGRDGWQKWVKGFGKSIKRKGKGLFMPLRVLLTGKLHGPDIGGAIALIHKAGVCGAVTPQSNFVTLDERFRVLKEIDWDSLAKEQETPAESAVPAT